MRLVVVLLFLVVLPTAILSLLAGHSIQARELLLYRRFEQDASERIKRVCERFSELRASDMDAVLREFRGTMLSGMDASVMREREKSLRESCNFVENVYLFMNPWNFIFPPEAVRENDANKSDNAAFLQQALTRQISVGAQGDGFICFRQGGRSYSFVPVPGYSEVYAGFSWDSKEALNRLRSILTEESIGDMELRISGVHGGLAADIMSPVQVYDSFNPSPSLSYRVERDDDIGGALSRAYLPAPLSDVEIAAFLVGEQDIRAAEALESNLIRWGVFLLAVVIMAGSAVIIFKTVGQVAAARQRSEFVVSMSHDLRTPVAAMRVLADSLCAGRVSDPVKQKEFVCSIASECERLGDMIERILFFFRQERGAVSYEMQELDVVSLTEEVVRTVEARFQGGLKVDFGVDDAVPMVRGDAVSLSKVITNLLDNAVKYGRPEGVSQSEAVEVVVRISKGVWRGRKCAVVKVSDRGCGIAEREHRRIFRRFYRVARDQHRHVGGIGLGLSLCMDIVRAHRGKIVVESEPGKGAEFSVWLRGSRKV